MLAEMLQARHLDVILKPNMRALCQDLTNCMAAILTAEALDEVGIKLLQQMLQSQPPWSDIPVILLAGKLFPSFETAVHAIGNVTIIQRPLSQSYLLSVVQSAVRSRRRQYEVRALLESEARQQAHISALNARLRRAMSETHHRVKNNLQIISALLDMQEMQYETMVPASEIARLRHHVKALANIHELLTQQAKTDAEVYDLSTSVTMDHLIPLLQAMVGARRIRFAIQDLRMPVRQTTTFAVLVNELVSNAIKHGAGEICVSFSTHNGKARLEVLDEGRGFPSDFDPNISAGTGLELIQSLARWDLQGDVRFENRPEGGARAIIEFPIPSLTHVRKER
jgi:two-component sensor histidine kinase